MISGKSISLGRVRPRPRGGIWSGASVEKLLLWQQWKEQPLLCIVLHPSGNSRCCRIGSDGSRNRDATTPEQERVEFDARLLGMECSNREN